MSLTYRAALPRGGTGADVEMEIGQAIRLHLEGLEEDGLAIPRPSAIAEYVDA